MEQSVKQSNKTENRRRKKRLVILGAGPKAAAIVSKAAILAMNGYEVPDIIVVEKNMPGANWSGQFGFTSGAHQLGTSPEKDVGFPYETNWTAPVIADMHRNFSWAAYLISNEGSWMRFGEWIDRGKPSPPHHIWQAYLKWVFQKAGNGDSIKLESGEVVAVDTKDGRWLVTVRIQDGSKEILADGLVITGPGEARRIHGQPDHDRIMDGKTFWLNKKDFVGLDSASAGDPICIVGAGETSASQIVELQDLLSKSDPPPILLITDAGMIYSRGENYFENSIYTNADDANWQLLSEEQRLEIVGRTDRGVFSLSSLTVINQSNVAPIPGRVSEIIIDPVSQRPSLTITDRNGRTITIPASHVVVNAGFDPWSFTRLFTPAIAALFADAPGTPSNERSVRDKVLWTIRRDLSVDWAEVSGKVADEMPELHVPMLSGPARGPGFPNLSCLGSLSDLILFPYVTLSE